MIRTLIVLFFILFFCGNLAYSQKKVGASPQITNIKFGWITIDKNKYDYDVIIDNGVVEKRKKGASKPERAQYGHTPLTSKENVPWDCKILVIGIGMSSRLPVTDEFKEEAKRRGVELIMLKTPDAIDYFMKHFRSGMNAIFHITC